MLLWNKNYINLCWWKTKIDFESVDTEHYLSLFQNISVQNGLELRDEVLKLKLPSVKK